MEFRVGSNMLLCFSSASLLGGYTLFSKDRHGFQALFPIPPYNYIILLTRLYILTKAKGLVRIDLYALHKGLND